MKTKINYYKILKFILIPVNLLLILTFLLNYFHLLPAFWKSIYVFYFALLINTGYIALKIKPIPNNEREDHKVVYLSKYFFLLFLIIIALNQFLKKSYLEGIKIYLLGLTMAFGLLILKANRSFSKKEESNLSVQKNRINSSTSYSKRHFVNYIKNIFDSSHNYRSIYIIFLILISFVFIAIKIGIPLLYTGSYLDETTHLLSGIEFFKSGHFAQLYFGEEYTRGAHISVLVGLFFKLFGKSIFVAKMIPALLGIINYFLLLKIAQNVFEKKFYILLVMICYTFSPGVIFHHFYIRPFVVYEFFLLLIIFLFFRIVDSLNQKKKFFTILYLSLVILVNFINYFLSNDLGKYVILIVTVFFCIYTYLYYNSKKIYSIYNSTKNVYLRIMAFSIIFIFLLIIFVWLRGQDKINSLIFGTLVYTTPMDLKYDYYFLNLNLIFTIFFFLSLLLITKSYNKKNMILMCGGLIFVTHLLSSKDLQLMRSIMYFIPIYYLISIYSISRINLRKYSLLIIIILLVVLIRNYPSDFLNGPYIPKEVNYKDYKLGSEFVSREYLSKDLILISSQPQINKFYNLNYYRIYLLRDNKNDPYDKRVEYYDTIDNVTRSVLTNIIVIDNSNQFREIINTPNKSIVLFIDTDLWNWATPETKKIIIDQFKLVKRFKRVDIYEYAKSP